MKKSLKVKAKAGWKELSEDDFIAVRIILVFASLVPLQTLSLGENRSSVLVASIILSAGMFVGNVILAGVRKRSGDFLVGFACLISIAINLFFGFDQHFNSSRIFQNPVYLPPVISTTWWNNCPEGNRV